MIALIDDVKLFYFHFKKVIQQPVKVFIHDLNTKIAFKYNNKKSFQREK